MLEHTAHHALTCSDVACQTNYEFAGPITQKIVPLNKKLSFLEMSTFGRLYNSFAIKLPAR
jgi:hypothetical protein